ncbi:MAG: divergent polysaccharide deacetylase family protein [Gammaproteobacteria bacterium]|nr:divergent polysaccharide deacetylase family protein [Gammaproteobacteria bacterium]
MNWNKCNLIWQVLFLCTCLTMLPFSEADAKPKPTISIIIDDVGDNKNLGFRAARLHQDIALSILPHTPFSSEIARFGHQQGMDILLHQPMQSLTNNELLGPGALMQAMDRQQFARTLEENINAIPFIVGINNHMGSLLTTDQQKMNWLMAELRNRDLFFIDSRTTNKSIANTTAHYWQLPTMNRRIFLDHTDDPKAIAKQFQRLLHFAKKYGHAIAIGHPKLNTLLFLEQELPTLSDKGITLISPSAKMHGEFPEKFTKDQQQLFNPVHFYDVCYYSKINHTLNRQAMNIRWLHYNCTVSQ